MGHYCQAVLVEWALAQAPESKRADLDARVSRWEAVLDYYRRTRAGESAARNLAIGRLQTFRGMGEYLAELGLARFSRIGSATLRAISSRVMVETILETLKNEPDKWFSEPFLSWWHEAMGE